MSEPTTAALRAENEALRKSLAEALEQRAATSEILKAMTRSAFALEPLLATLIENAARLSGAQHGAVHRFDGECLHLGATYGLTREYYEDARQRPVRPEPGSVSGRAVLERRTIHVPDVLTEPGYQMTERQRVAGFRTFVSAPLLRDQTVIGVFNLWKMRVDPFTPQQIDMLETFADHAVIAIENVRLLGELQARTRELTDANLGLTDALEQQTAIAEILRVINRSTTDVEPVLDAIVDGALRLTDGLLSAVYHFDGERLHLVASRNMSDAARDELHRSGVQRLNRNESLLSRVVEDREPINIDDAQEAPGLPPLARRVARAGGYRSLLLVPMLREGRVIGAIGVSRASAGRFAERHVDLLKTFADQAALAIENARLFQELQTRTQALSRSVDELTALAQISQTVSSTLDLETVLASIVSHAVQLSASDAGAIYEYEELAREFHLRVGHQMSDDVISALRTVPLKLGEGALGQAGELREPVQVPDLLAHRATDTRMAELLVREGFRALLAIPLLREDGIIGGLVVRRRSAGEFSAQTIDLLRTFAAQSALAIQNARLFREIAAKSRQLEIASTHKSQFLTSMSHELRTPLNAIIGLTEILLEDAQALEPPGDVEPLERILRAGHHLLNLVNDILDLAKVEAGRMELDLSEFELRPTIDTALTLVRERAGRRRITLERTVDARVRAIRADERKVRQVLLNLLSNAVKFTRDGGRIDVRATLASAMVEIAVADTGVGIAPEDQDAIFEEFRQVGRPERKAEGTGLGLALCRKFIELHGGRIWVTSEVGVGSTFTFTLPLT